MNITNPVVSVVVLTYNQEKSIGRTLDSILSQKSDYSFEIIIGEDASPSDNTRAVCEAYVQKYPEIIHLMPQAPNKGVVRNYIDCLAVAKGKYMAVCAGDDWWHNPDKLQMQVEFLETNPDYGVVHTECYIYQEKIAKINTKSVRKNIPKGVVFKQLMNNNFIYAPTALYKRELLNHISLEDYLVNEFSMEDYPMWLEMSLFTKFHHFPIPSVTYCINECSASHNVSLELQLRFIEQIARVKNFILNKYPSCGIYQSEVNRSLSRTNYMLCLQDRSYRKSFDYVNTIGVNKVIKIILKTYLGAILCSVFIKVKNKLNVYEKINNGSNI